MTTTTRVECTCKICAANAVKLNRLVLAAEIATAGVQRLGRNGKLSKQAIHGIVHAANHPVLGKALAKHRTAYWAA